ncbi:MAG TPA: hypothetical protein VND93_07955 [Myxococcales bacterium]|nr:hypothetical protein [Myxococcales bacterium]
MSLALIASACTTMQSAKRTGPTAHQLLGTKPAAATPTSCPYTPCGGDIQGDWTVTESCAAPISMGDPACSTSTGTATPSYTGTVKFNSDGSYQRTLSVSGATTFNIPKACVTEACSAVATGLNGSGYFSGMSCSDDGSGGCNCSGQMGGPPSEDKGTYTVSGNNVTTTPKDKFGLPAATDAYCVNGKKISIEINATGSVLNGSK